MQSGRNFAIREVMVMPRRWPRCRQNDAARVSSRAARTLSTPRHISLLLVSVDASLSEIEEILGVFDKDESKLFNQEEFIEMCSQLVWDTPFNVLLQATENYVSAIANTDERNQVRKVERKETERVPHAYHAFSRFSRPRSFLFFFRVSLDRSEKILERKRPTDLPEVAVVTARRRTGASSPIRLTTALVYSSRPPILSAFSFCSHWT